MRTFAGMKRIVILLFVLLGWLDISAQYDYLIANRKVIPGGYDFWVYTPEDYYYSQEHTPVIIFLHGASLCSRDLNRSRRYGPLDAIVKGRDIPALVVVPQNPGGAWNPKKINDVLEWTLKNYPADSTRVYVLGMSLGGYGTLDFAGTYPEKVAAAMALCGGATLKNLQGLGKVPLWILHGTADRAVGIKESKRVVQALKDAHNDKRLRYDWLPGANHGALARAFYMKCTYEWLFRHALTDEGRPLCREFSITNADLRGAYGDMNKALPDPEVIDD
jgi:predicted peptidase